LGDLTQLATLDISDNALAALPESLGKLTQLTELDLDGNPLPVRRRRSSRVAWHRCWPI